MTMQQPLQWALGRLASLQGCLLDPLRLHATLAELAPEAGPTEQLATVCAALGLDAPVRLAEPDRAHLPLLCFMGLRGWGVVVDREPGGDWVVARADGEGHHSTRAVSACCLRVQCDADASGPGAADGAAQVGQTFRSQLRGAFLPHRGALVEACLASAFIGVLALATSLFSMQVYDRVIPTRGHSTLWVLAAGVGLSVLIELAMKFARARIMDHVVIGVDGRLSREIFERLMQLRIDQLPASVGSLAAQLRGYEQVRSFYTASTLFALIDLPMAALFLAVVMMLATPLVALLLLSFGVLALVIGLSIRTRVTRLAREGASWSNMKTGLLVEAVEGAETIKAGAGGWKFIARWIRVNQASIQSDLKMRHASESTGYLAATVQQLSYAALIVAGAFVVMEGNMSTGALIACSILSGRILNPILALPGLLVQHAHASAAEESLEKLYKLKLDHDGVRRPLVPGKVVGSYSLVDVAFAYGDNPAALRIAALRIQPGERIAILGPIGAGKSTLLRLLSGLYVPQGGRVLLDGLDLSHISRQVVTRQIGYLQQDHRLFQGTLRDNLLIGLPDPGDEAILLAMRRTGMDRIVSAHPKGLDRAISEGGKGLSGGQRQLVAFTRLVLCNPGILLLDEPTASMDDAQETRCLSVLADEARAGKTLIVVTHKPSVLPLVNRIIVIAGTGVLMDGPRDTVLRQLNAAQAQANAQPQAQANAQPQTQAQPDPPLQIQQEPLSIGAGAR